MSLLLVIITYKYILVVLIVLELLVLNIVVIIFFIFRFYNMRFLIVYYLVFRVCERVLGITLLVIVVRFSGNELYYSFNLSKF